MNKIIIAIVVSLMASQALAASLYLSELPVPFILRLVQGEIELNFVDGKIHSEFEVDGFAAYSYLEGNEVGYLLDYEAASGSQWFNGAGNSDPVALDGSVFVTVPLMADLSVDGHEVDVYFDKLVPDVGSEFFMSQLDYTRLIMDGDALAQGHGAYSSSGDPDYVISGNMTFSNEFGSDAPYICIECQFDFEFNLVYLEYATGFLSFNPDDPRMSLMSGQDAYETSPYGWGLDINVRNVPLPGALVLMASALLGLGRFSRHRVSTA